MFSWIVDSNEIGCAEFCLVFEVILSLAGSVLVSLLFVASLQFIGF